MSDLHIPVRPDLEQLRHQAKDFLRDIHNGDAEAVDKFREYHPRQVDPKDAKLADAQLALARRYGVASWPRLKQACDLVDAIWRDDIEAVRSLVNETSEPDPRTSQRSAEQQLGTADELRRQSGSQRDH